MTVAYRVSAESQRPDDGRWCGAELEAECRKRNLPLHWRQAKANIAEHLNDIFRSSASDLLFLLQDDYHLHFPLDLEPAATLLLNRSDVGGVRFWCAAASDGMDSGFLSVLKTESYSYGDNPALWHRRFFEQLGPFGSVGPYGVGHEGYMSLRVARGKLKILAAAETKDDAQYWFGHAGLVTSFPHDNRYPEQGDIRSKDMENF
jgi:hypothetical protein